MPVTANDFNRIIASATQDILNRERIDMFGFYPLGQTNIDSLNPIDSVTMIEDMQKLWLNNPLAYRFTETFNDFVTGDDFQYSAEDEEVQKILDNYWKHPINNWETNYQMRIKTLSLMGEMILWPEVTQFAGKVKMTNLYPGHIQKLYKERGTDEGVTAIKFNHIDKPLKVIEWVESPVGGQYVGDIFYFPINKTAFQTRGLSDMYFWRDWLKLYDKNLYANAKRSGLLLSFIWDITIQGGDFGDLKRKEQQIAQNPPRPGSTRVHNEKETWKAEAPNLNGSDIKELNNLIKSQVIAGSGMPEWYYGIGEQTNLATAKVMSIPFFKNVKARKNYVKNIFNEQFKYVLWQAVQKGMLSSEIDQKFTISVSEPDPDKASDLAEALERFSKSVMTLQAAGLVENEEAKQILNLITSQLGVEIDVTEDETLNEKTMAAAHKFLTAYNQKTKNKRK